MGRGKSVEINGKNSTQIVYDAICSLINDGRMATRENIRQVTNMTLSMVDDRVKYLRDEGFIVAVNRGCYELTGKFNPPRVISKTILPDGSVVLDIGDDAIDLSPMESKILGSLFAGDSILHSLVGLGNQFNYMVSGINQRVSHVEKTTNVKCDKHPATSG